MTAAELWHQENTRHLAASIAGVRQMLERRANAYTHPPGPVQPAPREGLLRWFGSGRDARPAQEVLLLPGDSAEPAQPAKDEGEAAADMPPPALIALRQKLGLSEFELDIVVLCAAMELDTSVALLCVRAQDEPGRPFPTFALALSLFRSAAWEALSPESPLRRWRLIEVNQQGGQPLTVSALRIDEWLLNYLKGLDYLDDRVAPLLSPVELSPAASLPPSQQKAADEILERLRNAPRSEKPPVAQLAGVDDISKQRVASLVCRTVGAEVWRLPWNAVPIAPGELDTFARLWRRQSLLAPVALYIDLQGAETESAQGAHLSAVTRLLAQLDGLVFLSSREPWAGLGGPSFTVDIAKPSPAEQKAAWLSIIGTDAADAAPRLAAQFNLNVEEIDRIARAALAAPDATAPLQERLWGACLSATRPRLDTLAQRIESKVTWDDIVLPPAESKLLHQIADQLGRRAQVYQDWGFGKKTARGLGINALFSGESGTGKTMAAEVIANHLRLNLYRIDLSAVVSKYIGETEKNLRRLFDAAEDGGAMLFFDEADALFGKRSEVKDSHDRFANIEINYLLQRMESFGGLAILATNQKSALDPAFMRRLRFIVSFPFPGQNERKAIWQRAFPPETPVQELDFDRLAKLNLTGGHIALIALNAAFVAANQDSAVTMPIVLDTARAEFRKLERAIHEADFRWPPAPLRIA
jgi:ATPase family associated with various cellular activities (AAA)